MTKRVVITGIGLLTPFGRGEKANWDGLMKAKSAIRRVDRFDIQEYTSQVGGQVPLGTEPGQFDDAISPKEQRRFDLFVTYGAVAAQDAINDSGWHPETEEDRNKSGILMGSGVGGLITITKSAQDIMSKGIRQVSPFVIPAIIINMIGGLVSISNHYQGPNYGVVSACATGAHAIGDAARYIMSGDADVMVAGGAEAAITMLCYAGFGQARALSTHFNDCPEKASRPFDTNRDGFVVAEGAGAVVLEDYEHAKARGAHIYGELVGFGLSGDAYHITTPGNNGGQRAMEMALKKAEINPEQVDYLNTHGTSTLAGDVAEIQAVRNLWGAHANELALSSTKSMTGHMLGAAGAVEAVYSLLAMKNSVVPPTINLDSPDPCIEGLNVVPNTPQDKSLSYVMSNSFGFGGANACLIFKKV